MSVFDLHYLLDLTEFGRKRANPHASIKNNLKLDATSSKDCCTKTKSCKDTVTEPIPGDKEIRYITFDGIRYDLEDPKGIRSVAGEVILECPGCVRADDTEGLRKILQAIYSTKEYDPFCGNSVNEDGTVSICHIGGCILSEIEAKDGTKYTTTRCCDVGYKNTYKVRVNGETTVTFGDEAPKPLASDAYDPEDDAANAATAEALATAVTDCLTALAVPGAGEVTVEVNDVLECFEVSFCAFTEETIMFGTAYPILCEVEPDFYCAESGDK